MSLRYVQFGSGLSAPSTWCNFDASPTIRLQRMPLLGGLFKRGRFPIFPPNVEYGDIVKGLPLKDESCIAIYSSHVLEHLYFSELPRALQNIHSYLIPGGCFRFVMPDLEYAIRQYTTSSRDDAAITLIESTLFVSKQPPKGINQFLRDWLGHSKHLWLWDFRSIKILLEEAGFQRIRRAKFADSADNRFKDVEDLDRWQNQLGVECFK